MLLNTQQITLQIVVVVTVDTLKGIQKTDCFSR